MIDSPSITVIGAGYWGINLVRNFHQLGALRGICEAHEGRRTELVKLFPTAVLYSDPKEVLNDNSTKAVAIATPASTHFEVARDCLNAGKDVFVEKPLSLRLSDAQDLVRQASANSRILMVGHLLQHHAGLLKMKDLVDTGELGTIEYVYSNRLNFGKIRTEENILWSFAPHDISILLWLTNSLPIQVSAMGGSYLQPNISDTTISTYVFDNGVRAHIFVSWLHPFKEQRLVVVGSKKMATFVDHAPKGERLMIYDKTVTSVGGVLVANKTKGIPVAFNEELEPLRSECQHFLDSVRDRSRPRTDGEEGVRVLKVLQCCQRSLQMNGQPVQVMDYRD